MCLPVFECMNLVKRCHIQSCWMFQIPPDVQALFDDPSCTELNSEVCLALFFFFLQMEGYRERGVCKDADFVHLYPVRTS